MTEKFKRGGGGTMIRDEVVESRWREYFGQLLNGEIIRGDGNVKAGGGGRRNERLVGREMVREDVIRALKKMKRGKGAWLDRTVV